MPSIRLGLSKIVQDCFQAMGLPAELGVVTKSDRPDLCHFQCNGALPAAKSIKKNPREVANQLILLIQEKLSNEIRDEKIALAIAGPGFINFKFSEAYIGQIIDELKSDPLMGVEKRQHPRKVIVDFGSPNVAKSMHVGHLRSTILGDAIVRLYRHLGDDVVGDNHIGDWGTPMGMVICELEREMPGLPYFQPSNQGPFSKESPVSMADLERIYPVASKRFKEDPEFASKVLKVTDALQKGEPRFKALWLHFQQTTIKEDTEDYNQLNVHFDTWCGESFYEEKMPPLVEKLKASGAAKMSEGAWVIDLTQELGPEAPPLLLVKSGGGFLYHTSDLATIEYRVNELKAHLCIYVVDSRQSFHFKQVFAAAKLTGIAKSTELVHAGFGTMNGKDGKPFKTRDGGVLKLKDLIEQILNEARNRLKEMNLDTQYSPAELEDVAHKVGIATLKYADLKNNRTADYVFDLERFSQFEGGTGPYLLYATVRIKSILRKAREQGFEPASIVAPLGEVTEKARAERELMLKFLDYSDALNRAYQHIEPHHLCEYGLELSQAFNFFYKECHILKESDPVRRGSWLALCGLTHDCLVQLLGLLGILVPNRM